MFLVRKGNPKGIHDWDDLARKGIKVITPNPKTSGGARWNFLAAWGYGQKTYGIAGGGAGLCAARLRAMCRCSIRGRAAPPSILPSAGLAMFCVTWENEALLATRELGADRFEIIVPSVSIRAEAPVAIIDKVVQKRGTRAVAEAYLQFLYTPEAQEIAARNGAIARAILP